MPGRLRRPPNTRAPSAIQSRAISVASLPIHQIQQWLAVEAAAQILSEDFQRAAGWLLRLARGVRGQQNVVEAQELGRGLVVELPDVHVSGEAAQLPRLQRSRQRGFVDQLAARDIDQKR